jgi:hypothetical protein
VVVFDGRVHGQNGLTSGEPYLVLRGSYRDLQVASALRGERRSRSPRGLTSGEPDYVLRRSCRGHHCLDLGRAGEYLEPGGATRGDVATLAPWRASKNASRYEIRKTKYEIGSAMPSLFPKQCAVDEAERTHPPDPLHLHRATSKELFRRRQLVE